MQETILSIPSPVGSPVDLSKFSWGGTRPGKTTSIVTGIHGNHLNGIYLCSQLIRFLNSIETGKEPNYNLKNRIEVIPAINLSAIQEGNRMWSFDNLDMDLTFPGNDQGEITERVANAVYHHTKDSQYGIILHNGDNHYEDAPHLVCLKPDGLTKDFARSLGLTNVREPENSPTFRLCLYNQWLEQKISSIILCGGRPNHLNIPLCETLFSGLVNSLLWTGALTHNRKKPKKYPVRFNNRNKEQFVFASSGGFFLPLIQTGSEVNKGQKIGEIVDFYSGVTLESLLAKSSGYVVTLRNYPMVYQKEVLVVMLDNQKFRLWPF